MRNDGQIKVGDWITYKYIRNSVELKEPILRKYIGTLGNLRVQFITPEGEKLEGFGFPMLYRLATETEIKKMKLKRIFITKNNN
jgi:hypothetical protein